MVDLNIYKIINNDELVDTSILSDDMEKLSYGIMLSGRFSPIVGLTNDRVVRQYSDT